MAVTLNGIAQGFVTDKVVELLRSEDVVNSLVDMGENPCAMGSHPASRPWDVAVADPDEPGHSVTVIPIIDRALATSGPYGFGFDSQDVTTIFSSQRTGRCAEKYTSVSVVARTATVADALFFSTAFCFMAPADIRSVARLHEADLVHLMGVTAGRRGSSPERSDRSGQQSARRKRMKRLAANCLLLTPWARMRDEFAPPVFGGGR